MFNFNNSKVENLEAKVQRLTEDNEELLTSNGLLRENLRFYIGKTEELRNELKQTNNYYKALRDENKLLNEELDTLTSKLIKSEDRVQTLKQRLKVIETGAVSKPDKPSILKE